MQRITIDYVEEEEIYDVEMVDSVKKLWLKESFEFDILILL